MLSPMCFRILADPDKVKVKTLRFFLRIAFDFDLTTYRAISMPNLVALYPDMSRFDISKAVSRLVAVGILEPGPYTRKGKLNTYRIHSSCLLSPEDLQTFFRETRERAERETLVTKAKGIPSPVL
jgi:hypothetical protein